MAESILQKDKNKMTWVHEVVMTRSPIFDRKKEVFAYELLFKANVQDALSSKASKTTGTTKIIPRGKGDPNINLKGVDSLIVTGLNSITGGKKAVIHFSAEMLLDELPLVFPNNMLGIEISEEAAHARNLKSTVQKLKNSGYLLFFNDTLYNEGDIALVRLADVIGVDFRSQGLNKRFSIFEDDVTRPRFLAKSVETPCDFSLANEKGYQYFQGDFFQKGDLIAIRNIPSYKINFMRILKEINKPQVHFDQVETILKKDVSITYKLLRFVNSAAFPIKTTVQSIRHALNLLGEIEVKKWLSFIVLSGIGTDKPVELVRQTIIRAKFCEAIAAALSLTTEMPNFFLMGMFSMVDAFLDRPITEILKDLPLDSYVKAALLGEPNRFRDVLQLVTDYEKGNWKPFGEKAEELKLEEHNIAILYLEAVEWGQFL